MFCQKSGHYERQRALYIPLTQSSECVSADTSEELKKDWEYVAISGAVASVVAAFFGHNTTIPLCISAVGGIYWLLDSHLGKKNEVAVQNMLQAARLQKYEDRGDWIVDALIENATNMIEEKSSPMLQVLKTLFLCRVNRFQVNPGNEIRIELYDDVKKSISSSSKTLHLPKYLILTLQGSGEITFSGGYAPYECNVDMAAVKVHYNWEKLTLAGNLVTIHRVCTTTVVFPVFTDRSNVSYTVEDFIGLFS